MQRIKYFFMAVDPGWVRLEQSVKGALAYISAALVTLLLITLFKPAGAGSAVVYALLIGFISYMSANDSEKHARQRTLLLAIIPFAIAPLIVGFIEKEVLVSAIVLLILMFIAYYLRRYGVRMAELGMMTVFGFYFSFIFGADATNAFWFAIAGVVGVFSAYFWEFYVRPYDPEQYVHRSLVGLNQNVMAVVAAIQQQVGSSSEGTGGGDGSGISSALGRVQKARAVIEEYLSSVTSLSNYPQARLTQIRLQLFNIEQGLERMITGSEQLMAHKEALPDSLQQSIYQVLSEVQVRLQPPDRNSPPLEEDLAAELAKLEGFQQRILGEVGEIEDKSLAAEVRPALAQLGIGALQIVRSVARVRAIPVEAEEAKKMAAAPATLAPKAASPQLPAPAPDASFFQRLHPTTKLGLQAVLAVGLAMLASYLLKLDHANWAYWTAFVVIAGSTGESVRKIFYRVGGTIAGAFLGTLLVIILPDTIWMTLVVALFCLFLALYTRIVNYAWMVFWIVVFVALLYSLKGEDPRAILIVRPLNTIIGALIAVAVVWFVFPLHAGERFRMGLTQYFKAVDHYISTLADGWLGQAEVATVDGAKVQMEEIYDKVSQTFPAVAMEYNPITQARSPLSAQATVVQAIHHDVTRLTQAVTTSEGLIGVLSPDVVRQLQETFRRNVQELEERLAHPMASAKAPAAVGARPSATEESDANVVAEASRAETPTADWQQAVVYFGSLNHAISMLSSQIEASEPGGGGEWLAQRR